MQQIPVPEVLDPDRILTDDREEISSEEHRARAQQLDAALHASCGYARQLWDELAAVRDYLWGDSADLTGQRSPSGRDDDAGWQAWIGAYASVTSLLAGPHGDSGFGLTEAQQHSQLLRSPTKRTTVSDPPE